MIIVNREVNHFKESNLFFSLIAEVINPPLLKEPLTTYEGTLGFHRSLVEKGWYIECRAPEYATCSTV